MSEAVKKAPGCNGRDKAVQMLGMKEKRHGLAGGICFPQSRSSGDFREEPKPGSRMSAWMKVCSHKESGFFPERSLFITHQLEVKYITATATLTLVKPGWLGRGKVSAISYLGHVIYLQKYLPKQERKRQNKLTALGKIFDTGILTFYTAGFHRLHNHYLWFTSLCMRRGPRTLLNSRRKLSCEKQPWEELT